VAEPAPTVAPSELRLLGPRDAADLVAYLRRLLRYDRRAAVRLQAHGGVLAVFGRPPMDVVAVRTISLFQSYDLDVTVSAGDLLHGVSGDDDAAAAAEVQVPTPIAAVSWAGVLPPRSGWRLTAEAPADAVARAVAQGVAEFRAQTEALPEEGRTRPTLDLIAGQVWSRPIVAGVPLRAAHAAHRLGFLSPGEPVLAYDAAGWLRLDGTFGAVAVRRPGRPALRLA